ncbi:precorrin-6A/cobalt-precorrin-6A reductase [Agrobacterium vitis]|nr:precorrin-6A/cobalt-precorrin-6A reductase [Agrobacterium vitis]MBE1440462.1 precorrin-6A/cobalt-precorrin-6A reductase [Agrobacterium vitis]
MDKRRILILAGTTEARQLAERLCLRDDFMVTLSLAGRTNNPLFQAAYTRVGGFGGVAGLVDYLRAERFDLLIDATHPFANRISSNARLAAEQAGLSLLRLERPAWEPEPEDRWQTVPSIQAATGVLGEKPRRVFLAIGRQEANAFAVLPQHHYVVRSIEPVDPPLLVPHVDYILDRGPFPAEAEEELFKKLHIDVVVCKNSGGMATYGKIIAARRLRLDVVMIERTVHPETRRAASVEQALSLIDHILSPTMKRGV